MKRIIRCAVLSTIAAVLGLLLCSCGSGDSQDSQSERYNTVSRSDIIINEVLCSNSTCAKAYDGRYYDWIELYNPTSDKVSLDGYYLTDNIDEREKTSLKGQEILPGDYLLIYCSGLNITDVNGVLHTSFKLSATQGETVFLSDDTTMTLLDIPISQPDISYGRNDDGQYVWYDTPTPGQPNTGRMEYTNHDVMINEYMTSNTFTVYDCEGDYGDWVELYNTGGDDVDLTGYGLTDNSDDPHKYVFPQGASIGAESYLMVYCDGKNKVDDRGTYHTNFSLSAEDKTISLFTPEKTLSSSVDIFTMPDNISCGRAEGESELKFFARPTPGKANTTVFAHFPVNLTPDINDGVFISETLSATRTSKRGLDVDYIEIYNSTNADVDLEGYSLLHEPGGTPFFEFPKMTLGARSYQLIYCDGTYKHKYPSNLRAPIKISVGGETFYLANASGRICDVYSSGKGRFGMSSGRVGRDVNTRVFFTKPTPGKENNDQYYTSFAPVPEFSVEGGVVKKGTSVSLSAPEGFTIVYTTDGSKPTVKSKVYSSKIKITENTVIRAATFSKTCAISECSTQTYLIDNPHSLPIVCVSGKKSELISGVGILVSATNGTEYEVHVEYFDGGVKAVEFDCGAKHFGEYSLKLDQKGLRLSLREMYGQTEVSYPFFNENDKAATTFSSLLLRPSGQDQNRAKLRDELVPAIVRGQIDIDYQEYRACALYVNGQYWGLYYIRERLDANYLETYYGYEKGTYDLIKSQIFAQEGSLKEYIALTKFCKDNDLSVKENYEYVCSQVDLDSLINYWVIETFFNNYDTGNIRCYKTANGKWRWMIYDFDWGMTGTKDMNEKNYIDLHVLDPKGHGSANFENAIIRKLLANQEFKDRFLTTYCYHIRYTFAPERTVPILESMAANIESEIPLNYKRWKYPNYDRWKDKTIPFLKTYLESKPDIALKQLKSSFHLSESQLAAYQAAAEQMKQGESL